jgi:hypothetical protein
VWTTLGLSLAVIAAALVYKAWPVLHPDVVAHAPLNDGCDLRTSPCRVSFAEGGEVTLDIRPRGIPLISPLELKVALIGIEAEVVEIDFAGVDMNMGFNRVTLERSASGKYRGEGVLPVCVRDHMVWEARVMLGNRTGIMIAPFRFDTYGTPR